MQLRIPLAPVAFPFLCIARILGFALGAVVSVSLIGVAVAATTNGFGWRREVVSIHTGGSNRNQLYRAKVRSRAGWYTRMLGGTTKEREYLFSNQNVGIYDDVTTIDGRQVNKNVCRMIKRHYAYYNNA